MCEMAPNPGRIRIYTSGWPKNQNRCWYKTGSPPPAGSKNVVFRFRSVRSIVMAPARTGKDRSNRMVVTTRDHTNSGIRSAVQPLGRIFRAVVIKLIDPRIDETPARCKEKIARSTEGPLWEIFADRGGYTVQPVPAPCSTAAEHTSRISDGGRSQNLRLFIRGKAISGQVNISGIIQFPNPPTRTGITRKKIIRNAWAVTSTLYSWSFPRKEPGCASSIRIKSLMEVPIRPDQIPRRKYRVPISL